MSDDCNFYVAKTMALINCAAMRIQITLFSHVTAHIQIYIPYRSRNEKTQTIYGTIVVAFVKPVP